MKITTTISKKFVEAVKLSDMRAYEIAQAAGIHSTTLSQIINFIIDIYPKDPRVLAVAKVLGLKAGDCFRRLDE